MRIRWRLTLFGAAVTTAALVAFAILLNGIVVSGTSEDQDVLLAELSAEAATSLEGAPADTLSGATPPYVTNPEISDQPFVVIVDPAGESLFTTAPPDVRVPAAVVVETLETGASEATSGGIRWQASRFDHPEAGPGVAAAGQSTAVAEAQIAGFRAFLFVFGVITVMAATLASWLVTGRTLRSLQVLVATTDEIASTGDLSRRLPEVTTKDEVGALTTSFNGMLERLQAAASQLERTVESQRRFVADASHELRSPLTTIRSNAGFLRDHPDAAAADRDSSVADIEAEAERMSRLVNDLLLLARSDAGERMEMKPVALGAVVEDVTRKARHLEDRLTVQVEGPVVVSGETDALTQLIWILLDNAATHGDGQITLRVEPIGGAGVLTVADEGPGIPEGEEDRIFERFHHGDRARSSSGSGLGLAIARSIAEQHGGSIAARSLDQGGAIISVELPLL